MSNDDRDKRASQKPSAKRRRLNEVSTPTVSEVNEEGLRLVEAFLRINDPALRLEAINFVSALAKRCEESVYGNTT